MAKRISLKEKEEYKKVAKAPRLEPFQAKGEFEDEVTLRFDDGRELYVPATFLKEVSPVFKAMFGQHYKEGKTRRVELKKKKLEDFLDFLLLMHPQKFKPLTESNVWNIIPLAEEYQVPLAKYTCKLIVREWLRKYSHLADTSKSTIPFDEDIFMSICSNLTTLSIFSYDEEVKHAIDMLSAFPVRNYLKRSETIGGMYGSYANPIIECAELFHKLPDQVKLQVLFKRLERTKYSEEV